jgi:hypothetical protein
MKAIKRVNTLYRMLSIIESRYNKGEIKYSTYIQNTVYLSRVYNRVLSTIV